MRIELGRHNTLQQLASLVQQAHRPEDESGERPGFGNRTIRPSFHRTGNSLRDRHLSNRNLSLGGKTPAISFHMRAGTPSGPGAFLLGNRRFRAPASRGVLWLFLRQLQLLFLVCPALFLIHRSRKQGPDDFLQELRVHFLRRGGRPRTEVVQHQSVRAPPRIGVEGGQKFVLGSSLHLFDSSLQRPPRFAPGVVQTSHRGFAHPPPSLGCGVSEPARMHASRR
jgi:hypothetical protein